MRSKSAGRKLGAANLVGRRRVHTVIYGCKMINSASFVTVQGRYCRRVWIEQTKGGGQEWIVRGPPLWHCFLEGRPDMSSPRYPWNTMARDISTCYSICVGNPKVEDVQRRAHGCPPVPFWSRTRVGMTANQGTADAETQIKKG
jgi:hypothetical protein